jgi:hypothetical protein
MKGTTWKRRGMLAPARTNPELEFKLEHGSEKLLALLKGHSVYPFTDLERDSVPL